MSDLSTDTTVRLSKAISVALLPQGPKVLDLADPVPWHNDVIRESIAALSTFIALEQFGRSQSTLASAARFAAERTHDSEEVIQTELTRLLALRVLAEGESDVNESQQSPRPFPQADGALPDAATLLLRVPLLMGLDNEGFFAVDHTGEVSLRLGAVELVYTSGFGRPATAAKARDRVNEMLAQPTFSTDDAARVLGQLRAAGLLVEFDPEDPAHLGSHGRQEREMRRGLQATFRHRKVLAAAVAAHDVEEAERTARTGVARTRVLPVNRRGYTTPLALGMLMAYAKTIDGGRLADHFDFFPRWVETDSDLDSVADVPAVYLFSNYIWSHNGNIEFSEIIKGNSPDSITIHGGPDAPRNRRDIDRYLKTNPHIDIVVKGEGEHTFIDVLTALAGQLGSGPVDMSVLKNVDGIAYRDGDQIVHNGERDRIAEMDDIASPYLEGMFDTMADAEAIGMAIFETNRGCPYSCTYCDWGAATNSRIRKFDLERIFAEMEWAAEAKVEIFYLADANFGILARDVEIALKVAEVREKYGYPKRFATNYAKNTVKHLKQVIEIITGAGIGTEGLLSLQSMDEDTLDAIHRSNIKVEKYEDLAISFRDAGLPLFVDLMMGLPGQTRGSFTNDIQQCIDREVTGVIYGTEMLVNSPMNEPEYREEHGIRLIREPGPSIGKGDEEREHPLVVETATFTRDDYKAMNHLRRTFFLCENYGMLRQVSRFVRQQIGMREVDFLAGLNAMTTANRETYPNIALAILGIPDILAPPISWRWFIDELHTYLVQLLGLPDDSALATVLEVQHALLPAPGRSFPLRLELGHDYAAWHANMLDTKERGHVQDWTEIVPPLSSYKPTSFTINDNDRICELALGYSVELDTRSSWELTSPVRRPMPTPFAIDE